MYDKKEAMKKELPRVIIRLKNCPSVDQVDTGSKKDFIFRVVQDKVGAFEFHLPTTEDRRTWCDMVHAECMGRASESETSPPQSSSGTMSPPSTRSATKAAVAPPSASLGPATGTLVVPVAESAYGPRSTGSTPSHP